MDLSLDGGHGRGTIRGAMKATVAAFLATLIVIAGAMPAIAACCVLAARGQGCCAKRAGDGVGASVQKSPCCAAAAVAPLRPATASEPPHGPAAIAPPPLEVTGSVAVARAIAREPAAAVCSRQPRCPLPLRV